VTVLSLTLLPLLYVTTFLETDAPRLIQTLLSLRISYIPEGPAQVGIEYTHDQLYTHTRVFRQRSSTETQTATYWNLMGRSMTPPPPSSTHPSVLWSTCILPLPPLHCTLIPAKKNLARCTAQENPSSGTRTAQKEHIETNQRDCSLALDVCFLMQIVEM